MATDTPADARSLVIYEIFPRNHRPDGTFADVEADLPRIRSMGVDVVWLMPIHPIGKVKRKGSLGSPYSISDYREINPEYGTKDDFSRLIDRAHALGLKVMIDVVFNHTAHDSRLASEHPDWYHQDQSGTPVSTVLDWSDVIDLVPNPGLTEYLIETLQGWAEFGVDGFRCDVASLLPLDFWVQARRRVAEVKPGVLWLAESVHAGFVETRRRAGLTAISDSQLCQAFDMTYDYDIWPIWEKAVSGQVPVSRYLEMLRFQDAIYPANYVKMRYVENHDVMRIHKRAPSPQQALAWTAFSAFNKGSFLIYAGLESAANHTPSLFEADPIDWADYSLQPPLTRLAQLKKDPAITSGIFSLLAGDPVLQAAWQLPGNGLYGVFNVSGFHGPVPIRLPDGTYFDRLTGRTISVLAGRMPAPDTAAIFDYTQSIDLTPFHSDLLDD